MNNSGVNNNFEASAKVLTLALSVSFFSCIYYTFVLDIKQLFSLAENNSNTMLESNSTFIRYSYYIVITDSLPHYLHACRQCAKQKYKYNTITKERKK